MKFFCLKMVIFFCWWQGVAIGLLVKLGQINSAHGHSVQEVADLIQDLLISMEMLVAAIAFFNSFPIMEFANVRQFNWNPLSVTPLASSAVQPAMQSMELMGHSPKKLTFVPSVGSLMGSTAVLSTPHDLTITSSGSSNSNSNSSSSNSSSGSSSSDALLTQSDQESEKSRLIIPEMSTSIRSQSPVSDCGQSPSVYSSRKIFLPYAFPPTKSDSKEQNFANDKNGRAGVGLGKRMTVDSDADSGRATDFTSRLFALRGAGYELLRGVVPSLSFVPSSSFTISTNDNKKRQRHDSPPPNLLPRAEGEVKEEVGRRGDSRGALTDCRSDSNSPAYINRSSSYSHDTTTPLLLTSQGGRHGEDLGGISSMSQMGSKVKAPPHILAGLSPLPSPSQHASDGRGLPRGLKGAGAAVTLPSPVARRRAATTYQTGSINSSIININININSNSNSISSSSNSRLASNALCEGHTSDDSHIDSTTGNSQIYSRLHGSSPTPLRHSPMSMSMSMSNKEARSPPTPTPTHLTSHRGSGRKSVSPNIMEARKNVNHSSSSMCVRDSASALTDSQKANSNSNSSTDAVTVSSQSQPYLRSQSPARGSTGKKDTPSSSSSSAFQSIVSPSPPSSSSSSGCSRSCPNPSCAAKETHYNAGDHTIYHTPSQSRDGGREYTMRDSTVREERDDLRHERGYFIGGSTSNSASGNESYCLITTPITIIHIEIKR